MEIAIVGAGLAGIATCWHLIQAQKNYRITLFDHSGIGGGASGIAAGLVHPFAGSHAKKNWRGSEAIKATRELIDAAGITASCGILRVALTDEQQFDYRIAAETYDEIEWLPADKCQDLIPGLPYKPGIFINSGLSVNSKEYLNSLWSKCYEQGATLRKEKITSFSTFDGIFLTPGYGARHFKELNFLKLRPVKGQLLKMEWPKGYPPLPFPLNSKAYITMDRDPNYCWAGATFERHFSTPNVDIQEAKRVILPKAFALYPPLKQCKIIDCQTSVRMSSPDHLPKWGTIDNRIWYLTGLGSKGLLYHSLLAKEMVDSMKKTIRTKL